MVTIVNVLIQKNQETEEEFVVLELEGDVMMVQSQTTGNFYATTMKCRVTATFDEESARRMIGKQMPGQIMKVPCEPYDYVVPNSDEVLTLDFTYQYVPDLPQPKVEKLKPEIGVFSQNGVHQVQEA